MRLSAGEPHLSISRRQFIQLTVALAVAAPMAFRAAEAIAAPHPWVPTQAEVDQRLDYYRTYVTKGSKSFQQIVLGIPEPSDLLTQQDWKDLRSAETAFAKLESDRASVAHAFIEGYDAGRAGLARENTEFTGPSNRGFAWYNYWQVGANDRNRIPFNHSRSINR